MPEGRTLDLAQSLAIILVWTPHFTNERQKNIAATAIKITEYYTKPDEEKPDTFWEAIADLHTLAIQLQGRALFSPSPNAASFSI